MSSLRVVNTISFSSFFFLGKLVCLTQPSGISFRKPYNVHEYSVLKGKLKATIKYACLWHPKRVKASHFQKPWVHLSGSFKLVHDVCIPYVGSTVVTSTQDLASCTKLIFLVQMWWISNSFIMEHVLKAPLECHFL